MPRTARIVLSGYPHHVIQRGHNRHAVFAGEDDFLYYLHNLAEWKQRLGCKVYAFCLMTNHVHLVIAPGDDPESLGRLMKRLAGRQTRFVNRVEGRSGTLWEGRFKSSPIETNAYLLACCRYVEMNPVLAGMCAAPNDYPWSSCRSKTIAREWEWLDDDPLYLELGKTEAERRQKYSVFLKEPISDQEKEVILGAVRRGQLTGGSGFVEEIEIRLNRRVDLRGQGRPRKGEK
ncbi:MAG: transposase [Trichloromonadaceae bacterium]